ncbi:MAG: YdcF family protein [Pseudomonadota bacterium]
MNAAVFSAPAWPHGWQPALCAIAGVLLLVDAVYLMGLGLFSLGVTLPFCLGVGLLALGLWWPGVQLWLAGGAGRSAWWVFGWVAGGVWLASLALFWMFLARAGQGTAVATAPPRAIVVLGSGTPHGTASPVLAARLELALAQAARFPQALVLVSGGTDFAESLPEGRIMGDWLRARGLPPQRIVQEEHSTSTEANLRLSLPLLLLHGVAPGDAVLVVTSDFHTLRARWIARRAGYTQVSAIGAATPLYVRYNAWLREYFAVLSGFVLREF